MLTHLTDFPDRLSPMLVKELRQGMRAKTFIAVFLALQVFLAVMMFSATAASSADQIGGVVSGIIFGFFSVAVVLVQPLRGIGALSTEVKSNTLDMMVLTRLSASKIVLGKWVAIVSQSALLLSTIIPYLILRYFFGGMDLFAELVMLCLLFLTSVTLTAVTVGLSGCTSVIIRSLIPFFGLPVILYMLLFLSFSGSGSNVMDAFSLADKESRIIVGASVAGMLYLGSSMLSLGASLIAPAAENHSIWRRLVALVALMALLPLGYFKSIEDYQHALLVFVIAVPAIIIGLTESSQLVATVRKTFSRWGPPGKLVGWFFYPCWPSGVLFSVVAGLLSVAALHARWMPGGSERLEVEQAILFYSLLGSLFFPAVWQVFFFRGEGQRLANYLLILTGSVVMLGVLSILAEAMDNGDYLWFFAWNPLAFLPMTDEGKAPDSVYFAGVLVVDSILILVLLARTLFEARKTTALPDPAD